MNDSLEEVERKTAVCVLQRDGSCIEHLLPPCEKRLVFIQPSDAEKQMLHEFGKNKSVRGKLTIPEYSSYQKVLAKPDSSKSRAFEQLLRAEDAADRASHWLLLFKCRDSSSTHVAFYEVSSSSITKISHHISSSRYVFLPIFLHKEGTCISFSICTGKVRYTSVFCLWFLGKISRPQRDSVKPGASIGMIFGPALQFIIPVRLTCKRLSS